MRKVNCTFIDRNGKSDFKAMKSDKNINDMFNYIFKLHSYYLYN